MARESCQVARPMLPGEELAAESRAVQRPYLPRRARGGEEDDDAPGQSAHAGGADSLLAPASKCSQRLDTGRAEGVLRPGSIVHAIRATAVPLIRAARVTSCRAAISIRPRRSNGSRT